MATQFSVPPDNIDRHHRPTIARSIDVLQFDHSRDLLASANSDYILRVFSVSQNTYVLQRMCGMMLCLIVCSNRKMVLCCSFVRIGIYIISYVSNWSLNALSQNPQT